MYATLVAYKVVVQTDYMRAYFMRKRARLVQLSQGFFFGGFVALTVVVVVPSGVRFCIAVPGLLWIF